MKLSDISTPALQKVVDRYDAFKEEHPESDDSTSEATFKTTKGKARGILVVTIAEVREELSRRDQRVIH